MERKLPKRIFVVKNGPGASGLAEGLLKGTELLFDLVVVEPEPADGGGVAPRIYHAPRARSGADESDTHANLKLAVRSVRVNPEVSECCAWIQAEVSSISAAKKEVLETTFCKMYQDDSPNLSVTVEYDYGVRVGVITGYGAGEDLFGSSNSVQCSERAEFWKKLLEVIAESSDCRADR